jgi:L-ascorbate metabolism protein UlaG (beta-lactamase superfamily)
MIIFLLKQTENPVKPTKIIICPVDCEESLIQDHFNFNIYIIKAGDIIKLNRVRIEAIPAYSTSAHPNSAGWVGYMIDHNNFRIYHSGDSCFIPEMNQLWNIDIFFLTVREIIQAANTFKPKILVPIHWVEEEKANINFIKENVPKSTKVTILRKK